MTDSPVIRKIPGKSIPASVILATAAWLCCAPSLIQADEQRPPGKAAAADMGRMPGDSNKGREGKDRRDKGRRERPFPAPQRAWDVASIILGNPSDSGISISIYPAEDIEGYIEYGTEPGANTLKSGTGPLPAKTPSLVVLKGLMKDTTYSYCLRYRKAGETEFQKGPTCHFQTQRAVGRTFSFDVQGDSHPERSPKQNDPILYEQTLLAASRDRPDFYICMGDDFSVDTLPDINAASVARVYARQVPYLGLVAHSSPLFLVNGNHEQAARCNLDGTSSNVAVWAQVSRNRFFPQPVPDEFYTGDLERVENIGLLSDYYAWTWGDALFLVIDPYWHSPEPVDNVFRGGQKRRDMWSITLGDAQYKWLKATLEGSRARFKFVFAHHVNGTGRGGIEEADSYEWGGKDRNGNNVFAARRPGWELPIHQLMVKTGVTIFFQGHDHIFARQEKDGVVYQTLPDPANPHYEFNNKEAYRSGDIFPGSGRVRVKVSPEKVSVEYVRSYLPADATTDHPDGETAFSYAVAPKAAGGAK